MEVARGLPWCSDGKESACNAGDPDLIPGSGRSLGEGIGNPLLYIIAWEIPWTEEPGSHLINGHEFEQTPGDREGQGGLVCCSPCKSQTRLSN